MAEKSVAMKLQMKPGRKVRLVNAPVDAVSLLGEMPEGAAIVDMAAEPGALAGSDVILMFANSRAELEALLPGLRTAIAPGGMVWVAYHKGSSKIKTDIHRDSINAYAKTLGMEGIAMIAINDDWAALRLKPV